MKEAIEELTMNDDDHESLITSVFGIVDNDAPKSDITPVPVPELERISSYEDEDYDENNCDAQNLKIEILKAENTCPFKIQKNISNISTDNSIQFVKKKDIAFLKSKGNEENRLKKLDNMKKTTVDRESICQQNTTNKKTIIKSDKIPSTRAFSTNEQRHEILTPSSPSVKNLKSLFQHRKEDFDIDEGDVDSLSKNKVALSSVQAKKEMFEKINQDEVSIKNPTLHWKKTWKTRGSHGMYKKQMWDTRGVAPKKCLNDLP